MSAEKIVSKTILINALVSKVWEVLIKPELMKQWLSDEKMNVISDWKEGSSIIFEVNWHGRVRIDKGIILKLEPEKLFCYSYWSKIFRLPDTVENYAVMEFRLESQGEQTLLALTHSNLVSLASYEHSNFYWGVTLGLIKKMAEGNKDKE